jgi:hypothetical protein
MTFIGGRIADIFNVWFGGTPGPFGTCEICGKAIDDHVLGVKLLRRPFQKGDKDWTYFTVCEPCIVKKLLGGGQTALEGLSGETGKT